MAGIDRRLCRERISSAAVVMFGAAGNLGQQDQHQEISEAGSLTLAQEAAFKRREAVIMAEGMVSVKSCR